MKPLDFNDVVDFIKAEKGFEDYETPLGPDCRSIDSGLKNPRFPGDEAYGNGPVFLGRLRVNIPQELIEAQSRSFRDALRIYMNPKHIGSFMCTFYRGNFLSDPSFLKIADQEMYLGRRSADDRFTLDLETPKRKSRNRTYYTDVEKKIVTDVCRSTPELRTTVLAYQAGFMAYLEQLKSAFTRNDGGRLTERERERGVLVADKLIKPWSTDNFSSELLPAICLAYYKRDPSLQSPPLTEDFEKGFAFAFRTGVFQNHVHAPDGGERHFRCPARVTIGTVATQELGQEVCSQPGQQFPMGRVMASIYAAIKNAQPPDSPQTQVTAGGLTGLLNSLRRGPK